MCETPDSLLALSVHSEKGRVETIGILDTRIHLYIWVPPGSDRFTLGVYDQSDDTPVGASSRFMLYAPDGRITRTLEQAKSGAWSDYAVETGEQWGVWRLSVTGPEDTADAKKARNAFRVRVLGQADLYLRPESVARVRGLRLTGAGSSAEHRFFLRPDTETPGRVHLVHSDTFHPSEKVSFPAAVRWQALTPDDRLAKGIAFSIGDLSRSDEGPLTVQAMMGDYGLGLSFAARLFCTPQPLQPKPVRVRIQTTEKDSRGKPVAARIVATSPQTANEPITVMTDAQGVGVLPLLPGPTYTLTVTHGARYREETSTLTVRAGETPTVNVALSPRMTLPRGWYRGDLHLHTAYYDGTETPAELVAAARAEGLDFCFLTEHAHSPITERAERVAAEAAPYTIPDTFVVGRGMEYTSGTFHANVFGGIVKAKAGATLGDVMATVKTANTEDAPLTVALNHPTIGKTAADIARETPPPLLELWNSSEPDTTRLWWELLKRGARVFAETGSDSHRAASARPGYRSTIVFLGDRPLTMANIVRALRDGQSVLSRGAFIDLRINEARPGATIPVRPATPLKFQADITSTLPLDRIELVADGEIVRTWPANGKTALHLTEQIPAAHGWYVVQAWARGEKLPVAMTNPIFLSSLRRKQP
jgi:hypothetical protein